jgi:hypothetical protein
MPNIKIHFGVISRSAKDPKGPIAGVKPGPKLPRADAAPEKLVIKSSPQMESPPVKRIKQKA